MLMGPNCSQQHFGHHHIVFQPEQEVTRSKASMVTFSDKSKVDGGVISCFTLSNVY